MYRKYLYYQFKDMALLIEKMICLVLPSPPHTPQAVCEVRGDGFGVTIVSIKSHISSICVRNDHFFLVMDREKKLQGIL